MEIDLMVKQLTYISVGLLIFTFIAGFISFYAYNENGRSDSTKRKERPCEHGFTDWDYCPDCRH